MKIIVSHDGKQYIDEQLAALSKNGGLTEFITSFAVNKLPSVPRFLGEGLRAKMLKRRFRGAADGIIRHFPSALALAFLIKGERRRTAIAYRYFDWLVSRRLKKADFDIFIGQETVNLHSFRVAKKRGKTTVLSLAGVHHDFQNPVLLAIGTYQSRADMDYLSDLKEQALAITDYVLTLSSLGERALIDGGFPADRIYKTYLGINQAVFTPKTEYRTDGVGGLDLYFVGTMCRRKGIPFALELLANLRSRGLDIRLTLIGPLDDVATESFEVPGCRYIPFLEHEKLVALHHELDLFLFPSNMDSWAQVVIEAMACGSPVLISENTGAKDAVAQGGGTVLPVGDMAAWAGAVERFYNDRQLLETMGKKAVAIARTYTWEAYHEQVWASMEDIFSKNAKTK